MKARSHLALFLIAISAIARAEVNESIVEDTYSVDQTTNTSLLTALNRASPVRHEGKVFHAYTAWNVHWRFKWDATAGGCRITSVDTDLSVKTTLPEWRSGNSAIAMQFVTYLAALRKHEDGHLRIGRRAAQAADLAILRLPSMASCDLLEREANRAGDAVLEDAMRDEVEYDRNTRHGCTQGACLQRE